MPTLLITCSMTDGTGKIFLTRRAHGCLVLILHSKNRTMKVTCVHHLSGSGILLTCGCAIYSWATAFPERSFSVWESPRYGSMQMALMYFPLITPVIWGLILKHSSIPAWTTRPYVFIMWV